MLLARRLDPLGPQQDKHQQCPVSMKVVDTLAIAVAEATTLPKVEDTISGGLSDTFGGSMGSTPMSYSHTQPMQGPTASFQQQ